MKGLAIRPFRDSKEGVVRKPGDTFLLSATRLKEINKSGPLVLEVAEETAKTEAAAKSSKKTAKKG